MSRLRRLFGRYWARPSLQSVAIGLALALSVIAIILPQVQRSSVPEPIRETFSVGERVYELRVAPRPLTSDTSDAILAEAIGQVLLFTAYNQEQLARTDKPWLQGPLLLDFPTDDIRYQVRVTRLQGDPLMWADGEGLEFLHSTLFEMIPEGHEHAWTRWLTE